MSVWIIIDDKPGNANQAIALAKAMNVKYEVKQLKYNFLGFLPNWLKFNSLMGIDLDLSSPLSPPYPQLIISSGRKTAAVSNYIKKHSINSFVVHIMNPDMNFDNFDLICLPKHDEREDYAKYNNIVYSMGALSYSDSSKINEDTMPKLPAPFVSLIIGGTTKNGDYSIEELEWLSTKANSLAKNIKASLLITTSRRTPIEVTDILRGKITVPHYFYDWHKMQNIANPYPAFLKLSDYFITTGDSVSTCSEILATGKPLYIYRKDKVLYSKHKKFLDNLSHAGYIRYLSEEILQFANWTYAPLNEAERISNLIKERLRNVGIDISS
jgi:mitochondrial fission protein ELM1